MSFIKIFLPDQENFEELSYKEKHKISNLAIGCLICIPAFIALSLVLIFLYKFVEIGMVCFLPTLCFFSALICIKNGKVKTASYFATFGFIIATGLITFFAPIVDEDKLSTFVCYRTCGFCICMAIINYVFALRVFQLVLFHVLSFVGLLVSSFTVYKVAYDHAPVVMISAICINGIGIFTANMILLFVWKFNEKVLNQSEEARKEVEDLNRNLEVKVAERTRDLSEANKNLAEINRRSERDMALAVNVQRAFYPNKAPEVAGWEIAYIFNPMAGVSGDLFDFFYEGDNLKGCCLFDVSGHGIASGLVTMLSKTIIAREFEQGANLPLSKVMLNINDAIGHDKGDIENYLTGILLRINDNKIEYVNGAHPAMLCRSGSTGRVSKAALNEEGGDGSLIGIRELPASFTGINFSMRSGDSIMIYTDCLYESRNANGEEFGADRVAQIFSQAGNGNAQSQLSRVVHLFRQWTGDVPLNDDLTVIVIKKL